VACCQRDPACIHTSREEDGGGKFGWTWMGNISCPQSCSIGQSQSSDVFTSLSVHISGSHTRHSMHA